MDELNKPEEPTEEPIEEIVEEEEELGLTDKIISVLSEPGELFSKLANQPVKTMDWFLPLLLVAVVAVVSNFVLMGDPEIKANMIEKQMEQIAENFQEAVDSGRMSQEQADQQLDAISQRMEEGGSTQLMRAAIAMLLFTFIFFFIIAGVYLLVVKFGLKGAGDYKVSMLAYGLPHYIIIIQIVVMIIAGLGFGKMFMDSSVGSFMGIEKDTLFGWFMHKLDPISIWFYAVVGIAYAKLFKSDNTTKYIITIFALWIGFSLLFHFLAQALPFLKWFGM
jgi:hypothetical protein